MSDDKPKFPEFDPDLIKALFAGWNPYPSKAYSKMVGWHVNPDGTVDTPGLGRVPTSDLCEEKELEQMYEVADLRELYSRSEADDK